MGLTRRAFLLAGGLAAGAWALGARKPHLHPHPKPSPTETPVGSQSMSPTLVPSPSAASGGAFLYGAGIGGDTLANTRLGNMSSSGTKIQFDRFRAFESSALNTVTFYRLAAVPDPGYSGGTSGTWKLEVFADDGAASHFPTGSALASESFSADATDNGGYKMTFSTPATLVGGTLYHLVYTNTDADAENNFWSPDRWFYRVTPTGAASGGLNPRFVADDWAHGYFTNPSGPWVLRSGFVPILDLGYANGNHQGQCYGEASLAAGQQGEITGTLKMARERFTVTGGDRRVTGAGIRILKIAGGTDPLLVRLEDSGGTLIDSFTIAADSVADGLSPDGTDSIRGNGSNANWETGVFASPQLLVNGSTYNLRLSTAAGTTYWAWVNRRLSFGFSNYTAATSFADGVAEKTTDGSAWSALGSPTNKHDLQFYFF